MGNHFKHILFPFIWAWLSTFLIFPRRVCPAQLSVRKLLPGTFLYLPKFRNRKCYLPSRTCIVTVGILWCQCTAWCCTTSRVKRRRDCKEGGDKNVLRITSSLPAVLLSVPSPLRIASLNIACVIRRMPFSVLREIWCVYFLFLFLIFLQ